MDKKIMIVDDATFVRKVLREKLEKIGYSNIIEAEDGKSACLLYSQEKPDLVFMDVTLPNRDGIETLGDIKKLDKDAKIVMSSATGQKDFVIKAIQSGASGYIVKPFDHNDISLTIEKVLREDKW